MALYEMMVMVMVIVMVKINDVFMSMREQEWSGESRGVSTDRHSFKSSGQKKQHFMDGEASVRGKRVY